MEIINIPINKIKEDKNQPRKTFNHDRIEEMAQSVKTEGVINAIEVDKNFVIITGAMRFRSAIEAGLTEVPCKILDMEDDERFMRQVIENIHHNTMTDWDTAKAIKKLCKMSPGNTRGGIQPNDKGISWVSEKIGKSRAYIDEHLNILEASEEIQDAVKTRKVNYTMLRAIDEAPEEHKQAIEDKILNGEFRQKRDGALAVVRAIKNNPAKADQLMRTDYSKFKTNDEIKAEVRKIDPSFTETPFSDRVKESFDFPEELGKISLSLLKLLKDNPSEEVGKIHLKRVVLALSILKEGIDDWIKNRDVDIPEIN